MHCHFREAQAQHQQYKQRCNAFFMQLVGRLCFEGNVPPAEAVVHKLMEYVIHSPREGDRLKTRRPHVLPEDSSIDPTPVVRLFLLQLMLRSRCVIVKWDLTLVMDIHLLSSERFFREKVAIKNGAIPWYRNIKCIYPLHILINCF